MKPDYETIINTLQDWLEFKIGESDAMYRVEENDSSKAQIRGKTNAFELTRWKLGRLLKKW